MKHFKTCSLAEYSTFLFWSLWSTKLKDFWFLGYAILFRLLMHYFWNSLEKLSIYFIPKTLFSPFRMEPCSPCPFPFGNCLASEPQPSLDSRSSLPGLVWCLPTCVDLCVLSTPEVQFLLAGPLWVGYSLGLCSLICVLFSTSTSIPQACSPSVSVAGFALKSFLPLGLSQSLHPAPLCLCQTLSLSLGVFRIGKINYDWAYLEFGCQSLVLFFLGLFIKHSGLRGSKNPSQRAKALHSDP